MQRICDGYGPTTTLERAPRIPHIKNSETAIQRCSLKYNRVLKAHPNIKIHINKL